MIINFIIIIYMPEHSSSVVAAKTQDGERGAVVPESGVAGMLESQLQMSARICAHASFL